ncbi:NAD(P)-dependent dehydrogenase (short-subunit alcohol dehydrogenase family) [Saonia flava]|uniref:NAD(P)-dependent dehydrogenase (Short-subunit alcohol dehydrogenase family) n=1 Tax=Saonia flava TaxID=523696 RepID=A0A846R373_9FLAO|nr:SDR family oxidoreductase [Saonia flava]NJB71269.1 NAD(P)-dependent dehydrogenase (short-subunit alcohol dehydrogenase family) [Saonia flava]
MDLKLEHKTAFISGSTSGIGFATAKSLLKERANVIINGRTQKGVDVAMEKLKSDFPNATILGLPADFGNPKDVQSLLKQLPKVDILINNVGIYKSESFFETSDKDWYNQFEINVMSGVRLSKHCLPKMLDAKWGRILFISSECATLVPADMISYSMTKAAMLSISRGLAQLTKGTNVTVNTILPGSTLSEGAEQFLEEVAVNEDKTKKEVEKDFFTNVRTSSLIQRFAEVEEVANTITYLASPLSSATNGATIKVDGGSTGGIL